MFNDRSPAELESDFIVIARRAAKTHVQPTAVTTLLHIGDEHVVVLSGPVDKHETVQQIDLGAARMASDYFQHDPPSAQDIERAIDFAEDEIMRLGKMTVVATKLWSTSANLQAWAAVSGPTMAIETIEQWFQRLAAASLGRPGAMRGLPAGRDAAATLLILREFMHHRGHSEITFVDAVRTQV